VLLVDFEGFAMNIGLKEKIWGSYAGIAIGDAMGMPFHELTPEEIQDRAGGLADKFFGVFPDEFIHIGYSAGQVTDDTTLTKVTAEAILKYKGAITSDQFVKELSQWVIKNQDIWQQGNVYGPTTKTTFNNYLAGKYDSFQELKRSWVYYGTSNGAIMRVSPSGWANPGNWKAAVELACQVVLPTHATDVALSAASGQAAAISESLSKQATFRSMIDCALEGVKAGEELGKKLARVTGQRYPYPNLEIALELAEKAKDPIEAGHLIRKSIGSHFHVSETLATSFGIFYAAEGDFESGVIAAVNNGGDTDTIASIVGALSGALFGISAIPENWLNKIEAVNHLNCEMMADAFCKMVDKSDN